MTCPNVIQKFDSKMQVIIEKQNRNLVDLVDKMVTFAVIAVDLGHSID